MFCCAEEWQSGGPRRLALLKKWVQSAGSVIETTLFVITEQTRSQRSICKDFALAFAADLFINYDHACVA